MTGPVVRRCNVVSSLLRRSQARVRTLLALVACCGPLAWAARSAWESRPEYAAARALRALGSSDPREREAGVRDLGLVPPEQVGAVTPALIGALRDRQPLVRQLAAQSLGTIVYAATISGRGEPCGPAAAEALRDRVPAVRGESASALALIYSSRRLQRGGAGRDGASVGWHHFAQFSRTMVRWVDG
jgi:hypothetical protein